MGHAYVRNLSDFVVEELHARGELSFSETVQLALERGLTLNASEGAYDDEGSLKLGLTCVFSWLTQRGFIFETGPYKGDLRWRFTGIGLTCYPNIPRLEYIDV